MTSKAKCSGKDTCRCESCVETFARFPSRKAAREASSFTKFVMNGFKRVNFQTLSQSLVSIQPMTAPAGGVFYIDYTYGDENGTKKE